jgi:hypothetical protein
MDAEGDVGVALDAIDRLHAAFLPPLTIRLPAPPKTAAPQLTVIEQDLMDCVTQLQERQRIFRQPPSLEDLVNPPDERIDDDLFEGVGVDDQIVAEATHQLAKESGEVIEVDSETEEGNDEPKQPEMRSTEVVEACRQIEIFCLAKLGEDDSAYVLMQQLRCFRGYLERSAIQNSKQMRIDSFFKRVD